MHIIYFYNFMKKYTYSLSQKYRRILISHRNISFWKDIILVNPSDHWSWLKCLKISEVYYYHITVKLQNITGVALSGWKNFTLCVCDCRCVVNWYKSEMSMIWIWHVYNCTLALLWLHAVKAFWCRNVRAVKTSSAVLII